MKLKIGIRNYRRNKTNLKLNLHCKNCQACRHKQRYCAKQPHCVSYTVHYTKSANEDSKCVRIKKWQNQNNQSEMKLKNNTTQLEFWERKNLLHKLCIF